MPSDPIDDELFSLAAALHAAWHHADFKLRADLERVMRGYARREPDFRIALNRVVALHEQARPAPGTPRTSAPRPALHRYITRLKLPS